MDDPTSPLQPPKFLLPDHKGPVPYREIKVQTTLLHAAASKGDIREVRQALNISHVNVDALDEDGRTALHLCSAAVNARIARYLCENGASVNIEDLLGATPLHFAAAEGNIETVQCLLSYGAVDTVKDDEGYYAQDYANRRSDNLMVWMFRLGATDYELRDPTTHRTALIHFTTQRDVEVVGHLISAGADVEARDGDGLTALMHASQAGDPKLVELLCSVTGLALDARSKSGRTALMIAASDGYVEVLTLLVAHKPDFNIYDVDVKDRGVTALMLVLALFSEHFDAADVLLKAGASPETTDGAGDRPLQRLVKAGKADAITWLIKANVLIDAQAKNGWTPLHESSSHGRTPAIEVLLNHGAITEFREDWDGQTPMALAACGGHLEVARLLADAGANVNHINQSSRTPLDEAATRGKRDFFISYLSVAFSWILESHTPLHRAYQRGHFQVVLKLLIQGANPSVQERRLGGWTLGHSEMVTLLTSFEAKMEAENNNEYTPLRLAAKNRQFGCVKGAG